MRWPQLHRPRLPGWHTRLLLLGLLVLVSVIWWLPISGQIVVLVDRSATVVGSWPQIWTDPAVVRADTPVTVYVRDTVPWSHVKLLVNGVDAHRDEAFAPGQGPWTWRWQMDATTPTAALEFFHSCTTGCIRRAAATLGAPGTTPALDTPAPRVPTKLGVVFADPARVWDGKAGWTVELTYAEQQDDADFSIDGLSRRTASATRQGLRVLVRVAYDRQQALPPADDEVALARFLAYCARLARDDRLDHVYAYVIGAGFNTAADNVLAPDRPTTPEWYARVFNGFGIAPTRDDTVVATMRGIDPAVRVLVGPVAPWSSDQNGAIPDAHDVPWLNYLNTTVAYIDAATQARAAAGMPLNGPDGFALRAAGRVDAPEVVAAPGREPATDVYRAAWGSAQAGFRVYRDWLTIINRYPTTRNAPAYITSTNVVTDDTTLPPTQTYPAGWLTAATAEINREPQVQAVCWFVDQSLGGLWDDYSLSLHPGKLHLAAEEFAALLTR